MTNYTPSNRAIHAFMTNSIPALGSTDAVPDYHTDWNLLMAVREKLHEVGDIAVEINKDATWCLTGKYSQRFGVVQYKSSILATYEAIAHAVNYYNQQP